MITETKTADGLRSRLFDALDAIIDKKIDSKTVESICYVSEQILKTARIELETFQEISRVEHQKREDERALKREEKQAILMLKNTIEKTNEVINAEEVA